MRFLWSGTLLSLNTYPFTRPAMGKLKPHEDRAGVVAGWCAPKGNVSLACCEGPFLGRKGALGENSMV